MPIPNPPFDRLYSDIKLQVPGAVDAVIGNAMWGAVDEFLTETNVWVDEVPFQVQPNVREYVVTPSGKGAFVRLLMVFDPAAAWPEKRWVQQGVTFAPPNKIHLMYSPSTATTWVAAFSKHITGQAEQATIPLPTTDNSIDWIFDRYRDCLVSGTLASLYMQPARPYSNPQLAKLHGALFTSKKGKARAEVLHANVYGGQRWMYPQGYATTARKGWT